MSRLDSTVWENFIASHAAGDIVEGRVEKTVPFGAFIEVAEGIHGLLVGHRPEVGSTVSVAIKEIDTDRQRLSFLPA